MTRRSERLPKFTLPDTSSAVPLPRLSAAFEEATERPVTWLSGPGGSGKTTLTANQLRGSSAPVVWLQLDEDDADPATFFHFLSRAVNARFPRRKIGLAPLTPEYALGVQAYVRHFLRTLFESLPTNVAIVIDNAQFADREAFFDALIAEFADEAPPSARLLVASRHLPPDAASRLVVRSKLASIEWKDLQLSNGELRSISTARGRPLPDATLARLDGWVAGLVLATQAPDLEVPDKWDAATQELAFAYFATEILGAEPIETQRFLAANALWPRFTAESAKRLTGNSRAAAILRRLFRENFFTTRHGEGRGLYTFHPLFRSFLQQRAEALFSSEELSDLKVRAAGLLEQAGDLETALELRVAGSDWPDVARLANQYGPELLYRGRHLRMLRWLERAPAAAMAAFPALAMWRGLARVVSEPRAGFADIDDALEGFERTRDVPGLFTALVAFLESRVLLFDFRDLAVRVEQLLALRAEIPQLRAERMDLMAAPGVLGALSVIAPNHAEVMFWAGRLERLVAGDQPVHRRLMSGAILMFFYTHRGMTAEAEQLRASLAASALEARRIPYASISWQTMSGVHRYWYSADLEGLADVAAQCWTLSRDSGIHTTDHFITDCGCLAAFAAADLPAAEAQARRLEQIGAPAGAYHRAYHFLNLAWNAWLHGNFTTARERMDAARRAVEADPTPLIRAYTELASAHVAFELGNIGLALASLAKARTLARSSGFAAVLVMARYLSAEIALVRRQQARARPLLRGALEAAARLGLYRTLFYSPDRFARLLGFALRNDIDTGYTRHLIGALNLEPVDAVARPAEWVFDIEIYTLGEFRLTRGGQPIAFGRKAPRRALQLLQAIIASGGRNVALARLTHLLWPDLDGDAATRALRTALYRLRKIVGDRVLETSEDGVSISQRCCWVDAFAFEQLTRGDSVDSLPGGIEAGPRDALSLYRGHFLTEVDSSWVVELRERLRMRATRLVDQGAERFMRAGQWAEALHWYQQAVEIDPTAESFYQGIMRAQLAAGQHGDAANTFRTLSRVLGQAFGVQPGSASRALYAKATSSVES